ncbi:MAG TPA: D-aminoacylase [Gemmatimonadaceae bacterium]|nr:D-aminoacylase [Gemmatimonadaceae bacterium]
MTLPTVLRREAPARVRAAVLRGAAAAVLFSTTVPAQEFDVLIRGGTVIDGTGAQRFRADVALKGDRIALISREGIAANRAARVIDASNRIVAPGFIDVHAHIDPLPQLPGAESAVRQGVTFALGGPDGGSPLPLGRYMTSRDSQRIGINVGYLVGHNTVRQRVMGTVNRAPTVDEMRRMKALIAEAMGQGAFGISTGLRYLPGNFAKIDEVIELSRVASDSGGIYTSHLREEGLGLIDGVAEAITIGREAKIPIVLTHHKAVGQKMWGQSVRTLAMLDSARAAGIDVMADVYPYTATSTGIGVLIPTWAFDGGDTAFTRRLGDPALKDSITKGIIFNLLNDRGGGDISRVQFSSVRWQPDLNGKTLADWARQRGIAPTPENGAALVIEAQQKGGAAMIYHVLEEQDVQRIMQHPHVMIGSDGRLARMGDATSPHPRAYGTFPRVLGRYSRDLKLFPLETAVYKMSGQSAARLGVRDRGTLKAGNYADVVVFDPTTVADRSTFETPHQYPVGIDYVFVNGKAAVDNGTFTDARSGRVLKRIR